MKKNGKEQYSMILLAGGKSTRMGTDKAGLIYRNRSFARTLLEKGCAAGIEKIYVSGLREEGFESVQDIYPEKGPLGGLHACLGKSRTPYCLVLPVDVPQIPVTVLEQLLEFHQSCILEEKNQRLPVLLKHGDRRENLIGIYPAQMAAHIEELICENRLSVHRMLDNWGCLCFETAVEAWKVENINTKELYEKVLRSEEEERQC